jgi:RNA polymerase sigma-70 factor (ECF subfamily)
LESRQEHFASHFIKCQDRVFGFIVTMLPNRSDAEEVFQQTSMILWRKWGEFAPGADANADFVAWACGIARYEVLNFLRKAGRRSISLSAEVVELLTTDRLAMDEELAHRRAALERCIDNLQPAQRRMMEDAYGGAQPIKSLAARLGQSANAVYLTLRRIRQTLADCITRRMAEDEA